MEWISVNESLPEPGTPVLTYPGWASGRPEIDEYVPEYKTFLMHIEEGPGVTHWMPLPQPPQE